MNDSVFESTIRYVGALLSAYELSNATLPVLVKQAQTLAGRLTGAWIGVRISACHVDTRIDGLRRATLFLTAT